MKDANERITIRLTSEDIEQLDLFIKEKDYPSRSAFFRDIVRKLVNYGKVDADPDTVSVKLPPLLLEYIDSLVAAGYYRTREIAIESCVSGYLTPERVAGFGSAVKSMAVATGKHMEPYVYADRTISERDQKQ